MTGLTIDTTATGNGNAYGDDIKDFKTFTATDIPQNVFSITVSGDTMFPNIYDDGLVFCFKCF